GRGEARDASRDVAHVAPVLGESLRLRVDACAPRTSRSDGGDRDPREQEMPTDRHAVLSRKLWASEGVVRKWLLAETLEVDRAASPRHLRPSMEPRMVYVLDEMSSHGSTRARVLH